MKFASWNHWKVVVLQCTTTFSTRRVDITFGEKMYDQRTERFGALLTQSGVRARPLDGGTFANVFTACLVKVKSLRCAQVHGFFIFSITVCFRRWPSVQLVCLNVPFRREAVNDWTVAIEPPREGDKLKNKM